MTAVFFFFFFNPSLWVFCVCPIIGFTIDIIIAIAIAAGYFLSNNNNMENWYPSPLPVHRLHAVSLNIQSVDWTGRLSSFHLQCVDMHYMHTDNKTWIATAEGLLCPCNWCVFHSPSLERTDPMHLILTLLSSSATATIFPSTHTVPCMHACM